VLHFRPAVVLEAIELRHRIAALERDRTRGPCSQSWDRAALDLALALVVVLRAMRGEAVCPSCGASVSVGRRFCRSAARYIRRAFSWGADCLPRRGDSNSKASSHVRRHQIPSRTR
jgi:hypothetical protein